MTWTFERIHGPSGRPIGGLAWDGAAMLASDVQDNTILRFDPSGGAPTPFRRYTNRTSGIAFGPGGVLYGAQEGSRRVICFQADGSTSVTQTRFRGVLHNCPNALAVDSQGRVWFSDPYNPQSAMGPIPFPLLDHQSVLRLSCSPAPQSHWSIERMTFDTRAPRGIALSPDERTLYVAENELVPGGRRELRAYPIDTGVPALDRHIVLHTAGADPRGVHRGIEGLCADAAGNVVGCGGWTRSGPGPAVTVFSPNGHVLESHALPADMPTVCAFGGPGMRSLYVGTADGTLLCVRDCGRAGWQRHTPVR
jgi:gluconolactonase